MCLDHKRRHARARRADVAIGAQARVQRRADLNAKEPQASNGGCAHRRRVLAHATGENKHVKAFHGRGHGCDQRPQAMDVDIESESCSFVAARPSLHDLTHVRVPASAFKPPALSSPSLSSGSSMPACRWSHRGIPGSTVPERVAITRPSSGVKPMVVSTERPPNTAASDAPAPRWQVTTLSPDCGRESISAARLAAYACEKPWNP